RVSNRQVKDVMSRHVITIGEDSTIAEVVELMLRMKVHRLPVMDGKRLVGIITRHDLLKLMVAATPALTE
ncbi:MAG: CBS domain-containing protein, partial [Dehalococcoidia bacterium]